MNARLNSRLSGIVSSNGRLSKRIILIIAIWPIFLLLLVSVCGAASPFTHIAVGEKLQNRELPRLAGGHEAFLGTANANVFMFFRPDKEHSQMALKALQELRNQMADKSVHWTAIVADTYAREDVAAFVEKLGIKMAVLVDRGNQLYGRLGVIVLPLIGIADAQHRLAAYVPFRKLNFATIVEAHVRRILGEISEEQLQAVLNPAPSRMGGQAVAAKRNLRMAEMFRKMKKYDTAIRAAKKSAALNPNLAAAHALIGAIYADQGQCEKAIPALQRALKLAREEPTARAALAVCPIKRTN